MAMNARHVFAFCLFSASINILAVGANRMLFFIVALPISAIIIVLMVTWTTANLKKPSYSPTFQNWR